MRVNRGKRSVRVLVLVTVAGLIVVGIASQLFPLPRGDHELRVYSHDGRFVARPSFCILSSPGQPPDFASSGTPLIEIPAHLATEGREIVVAGPGCGLLRAEFKGEDRLVLPPPIAVTIRVPGRFKLPSGDRGIALAFYALGVSPEVASSLLCAPVSSDYWDGPDPLISNHVWLDPATRSASALLPCSGEWRVVWAHMLRPKPGERDVYAINLEFGKGQSILSITSDRAEHALAIDPKDLDTAGMGDD